ncbi:MAG: hypothetical protein JOZ58_07505 [Acetobacteraceae bacterium]|nr:hypothetical protein [Acetobacteraceae bacterium]
MRLKNFYYAFVTVATIGKSRPKSSLSLIHATLRTGCFASAMSRLVTPLKEAESLCLAALSCRAIQGQNRTNQAGESHQPGKIRMIRKHTE